MPSQGESPPAAVADDRELIRKCQAGDKSMYGILVRRYMKRAYLTALGLIGRHEVAQDLSQDAFVRAFRAIKRFDLDRRFFTWYYQILRNLCLNYLRDRARRPRAFSEMDENFLCRIPDQSEDSSTRAERNETKELVWKALKRLKPHEREMIILKDFQDLSYKEIAELLDCPIGTVMSRLFSARKALKQRLEKIVA